ncbi:MAG TPA: fumarylacetoacetate hydrolase family protein [Mycobacteriales bacterium]|nr:fumarylacetoacetate hydrolase family protein [Mycobacteriales bacterium]
MSWVQVPEGSGFGIDNLPYGVVGGRVVVRLGDGVLDLAAVLTPVDPDLGRRVAGPSLDRLLAAGPDTWAAVRDALCTILTEDTAAHRRAVEMARADLEPPTMPFTVADYVDFYSSEQHATNVGRIFRPDAPALPPAWKHLPIGYHGRSGTVAVSGTPVVRPRGVLGPGRYGPSERLDIEAEVGFVVGVPSHRGTPVAAADWRAHVFGVVLVNDWSARDIQAFETRPLGPFLGKSFLTSVSPWVVPLAALEPAFVDPPAQDPRPLEHLLPAGPGLDLTLEVRLNGHVISRPPAAALYWTAAQQLAHLTANGASLRTGDLFASGTVSGDGADQLGSLLELTRGGRDPLRLPDGTTRAYLEDGDTVTISARAGSVALGEVTGTVDGGSPPPAPVPGRGDPPRRAV